jgi:hypothetical protein
MWTTLKYFVKNKDFVNQVYGGQGIKESQEILSKENQNLQR